MNQGQYLRHHVPANKIAFDESSFDELDETKAWLLGWLWADGMLRPDRHGCRLALKSVDESVVLKLRETLRSEHNIQFEPAIKATQKDGYRLELRVRDLGQKLASMGMTHPKATRRPPPLSQELLRHFLRGYFEGDGCAYHNGKSLVSCITAYEPMAIWIKAMLQNSGVMASFNKQSPCVKVYINRENTEKLARLLYTDAHDVLDRKKNQFAILRD